MFRTILVPHDFSQCASRAEALAADWAQATGARVVLFHACQLPAGLALGTMVTPEGGTEPVTVENHVLAGAKARLEQRAAALRERGIAVTIRMKIGEIGEMTLEEARASRADVIIMGTHGRSGLRHFLLGSVAEKVIRSANVPVVTLRYSEEEGVSDTAEEESALDEQAG